MNHSLVMDVLLFPQWKQKDEFIWGYLSSCPCEQQNVLTHACVKDQRTEKSGAKFPPSPPLPPALNLESFNTGCWVLKHVVPKSRIILNPRWREMGRRDSLKLSQGHFRVQTSETS